MSHALARLREMYGDPLFVRLAQGLRPTPFAEQLAGPVSDALQIIRSTLDNSPFNPSTSQRTFRVAMTDIGEQIFLPLLTQYFAEHAPNIKFETTVTSKSTNALVNELSTGDIDLAYGFISNPGKEIFQKILFSDTYVCVVRGTHPAAQKKLDLAGLKQLRHVVPNVAGTGHANSIDKVLLAHGISENVVLRVTHFLSIAPLIASTDLVATVPRNLANTFVKSWKLALIEPPVPFPSFDVTQYWHTRYHHEPGLMWLRNVSESIFLGFMANTD